MGAATFKRWSRAQVIALVIAVALASDDIKIPTGRSSGSNWTFVADHPTILLHVVAGVAILVTAIIVLIMAIRSRNRTWLVLSAIGLAFVLLAFASGDDYVATLHRSADDYMGVGWSGAIVTYGTGWYVARKVARQEQDTLVPGSYRG
jgi:hypothetical protein